MRYTWAVLILLLCLETLSVRLAAQQTTVDVMPVGSRVRVVAPSAFRQAVAGRVSHIASDTLFLAPKRDRLVAVPVAAITSAEISRGVDRWRGAFQGAGTLGLAGGALFGLLVFAGDPNCDYCLPGRNLEAAAAGAVIGAVLFAPVGAVIGAVRGAERWEPITSDLSVRLHPYQRALNFSLTIRIP